MKVSLLPISMVWIGVILIATTLIYFTWKGFQVYELFQGHQQTTEGFKGSGELATDIVINTCPSDTISYVNTSGQTLCCEGTPSGGKCNGKSVCSLSEQSSGLPTCGQYLAAKLDQKGSLRCPASMPRYFESKDGSVKGCTAGNRLPDGTGPASTNNKSCKLYSQELDDLGRADSCTNVKMLESTQCFTRDIAGTNKQILELPIFNTYLPALVQCTYGNINSGVAGTCIANNSLDRMMDFFVNSFGLKQLSGWRKTTASWDPLQKINYCSIAQQYSIDKTLKFEDLPTVEVY
jgi:hypothetical protein